MKTQTINVNKLTFKTMDAKISLVLRSKRINEHVALGFQKDQIMPKALRKTWVKKPKQTYSYIFIDKKVCVRSNPNQGQIRAEPSLCLSKLEFNLT